MIKLPPEIISAPTSQFVYSGIEFFGPLFVKFSRKTRANKATFK